MSRVKDIERLAAAVFPHRTLLSGEVTMESVRLRWEGGEEDSVIPLPEAGVDGRLRVLVDYRETVAELTALQRQLDGARRLLGDAVALLGEDEER